MSPGRASERDDQRPPTGPPKLPPVRVFVVRLPDETKETVYAHNIGESEAGSIYFTTVILFEGEAVPVTRRGFAAGRWVDYEEIVLDKAPGILFQ